MIPNRILHPGLAQAMATVGHGDIVLVTDAGFPIPKDANRIDLGFYAGLPDVIDILKMLRKEMFVEAIGFDTAVRDRHPDLYKTFQDIYTGAGAPFLAIPHEELVEVVAPKAKVIIRSGSFNAWANVALTAATDPFAWFNEPDIDILPAYVERRRMMRENVVPELKD
ncbi:RbsD/FucU domain-containing protein [Martelella endophytica]|uniref:D-ribose pyranase n=1 Tax=Martelella endophytica TaxID=1486262 RepID=A0A0D5LNQ6_MAREN|nr:RbsD/FucU domain-containing protein [Martelella endophytica]AJY44933.1 carbohydrate transporter [Martelella endophytica]